MPYKRGDHWHTDVHYNYVDADAGAAVVRRLRS
jgi:hypothetical protein